MISKERRKRFRMPQQEAYTLKDLDQIKVLADPLRIRGLEAFCQERTTKQVADLLNELLKRGSQPPHSLRLVNE